MDKKEIERASKQFEGERRLYFSLSVVVLTFHLAGGSPASTSSTPFFSYEFEYPLVPLVMLHLSWLWAGRRYHLASVTARNNWSTSLRDAMIADKEVVRFMERETLSKEVTRHIEKTYPNLSGKQRSEVFNAYRSEVLKASPRDPKRIDGLQPQCDQGTPAIRIHPRQAKCFYSHPDSKKKSSLTVKPEFEFSKRKAKGVRRRAILSTIGHWDATEFAVPHLVAAAAAFALIFRLLIWFYGHDSWLKALARIICDSR